MERPRSGCHDEYADRRVELRRLVDELSERSEAVLAHRSPVDPLLDTATHAVARSQLRQIEVLDGRIDGATGRQLDELRISIRAMFAMVAGAENAIAGPGRVGARGGAVVRDLRRAAPGRTVSLTVGAIVPDRVVGGAELAVECTTGERLGLWSDRYALVRFSGDSPTLAASIRAGADGPVRFRTEEQDRDR